MMVINHATTHTPRTSLALGQVRVARRGWGFTLIELVVTIGVLTILLAVTLPAVSAMLEGKNRAQIQNTVHGILRSARIRALHSRETGLFFYLDGDVQKAVFIEAEPVDKTNPDDAGLGEQAVADRFRVIPEQVFGFPPPFRVTPLDVLRADGSADIYVWNDDELSAERPAIRSQGDVQFNNQGPRYHRNFCTIIFDAQGKVVVGRSVLIHDAPGPTPPTPVRGVTTGLALDTVNKYHPRGNSPPPVPSADFPGSVADLVFGTENGTVSVALNFPSVDGVLLYDDSLFKELPRERREFIARTGQPMYISRQTGRVIAGPVGENDLAL